MRLATGSIDTSQRVAARIVGFTYLFGDLTSAFSGWVRAHLIVLESAAQTAQNIVGSERLFRLSIASDLCGFASDAVLAAAFYVLLKPVNKGVALFGSFARLADAAILAVVTLNSFIVLRLLSGAEYLHAFRPEQLQGLARLFLAAGGSGYQIGLVFAGLGSACTSYLLLRSGYIPRALAALGVFSSLLLLACVVAIVIFPNLATVVFPWVALPILIFELVTGSWLLIRGLPARVAGG